MSSSAPGIGSPSVERTVPLMKHGVPGAPLARSSPFSKAGEPSMKNGPKTVDSVAPGGRRWFMPTTSIDSPRVSEARTNSWRLSSVMWPVRVRKSMAANHSSSVSWTSLAKACRWRTSDCRSSRRRGSGVLSKLASTARVRSASARLRRSFVAGWSVTPRPSREAPGLSSATARSALRPNCCNVRRRRGDSAAMALLMLFALVAGAGTALSPCVLPVLPALLSVGLTGGRRRPVGIALGLAATFTVTIVGLASVIDGVGLGPGLTRTLAVVVLIGFGVVVAVPSLAARLEAPLARLSRLGPRSKGDGFASGLLVGAALGFVYAPCAGPVLAAVVSVSAVTGRTVGVALAYVAGSAAVLAAIALGGRRVLDPIRRAGPLRVQRALGAVLLATAIAFAAGLDMDFETALARHTSDITLTAGLERSGAVQGRLGDLHGGRGPPFGPAARSAGAHADLPDLGHAPDFVDTQRWFNTAPLSLDKLKGRVVLIDFWTYTCINCLRTLPYLEAWDQRYRAQGLTIVGVHAPEFGFEHDAGNVQRAIENNHIAYPVVQDNNLSTWNAWGNQYWPAEYLIDARGEVRHTHFGEGDYGQTESAIRALLAERGTAVSATRARPHGITPVGRTATPETYVGTARAQGFVGTPPTQGTHTYTPPAAAPPLNGFALGGTWTIGDEPATAGPRATLDATVQGRFVYLVLSPPSPSRAGAVTVTLDGGRPRTIRVDRQKLYTLAALPRTGRHRLHLAFARGTSAYAFTFG